MRYKKIVLLLFSLLLLFTEAYSQINHNDTLPPSATATSNATNNNILPLHQLHVGVQLGSVFATTSGYGSGFSTYLSPILTYPVSRRFSISGGISVTNTQLYGVKPFYPFAEGSSFPGFTGNLTQTTLWVSGQYLLSDRITLTGTLFKTISLSGQQLINSPFYNNNPQGGYLNIGYKVSNNMHIEAGFGYTKGYNGYYYNPYNSIFGSSNINPFFNR
jgi:hypothetical protein